MSTWTTKFRNSALVAGVLAISLAVNPASAGTSGHGDKGAAKRGMAGFTGGAIIGAAAGGPLGMGADEAESQLKIFLTKLHEESESRTTF